MLKSEARTGTWSQGIVPQAEELNNKPSKQGSSSRSSTQAGLLQPAWAAKPQVNLGKTATSKNPSDWRQPQAGANMWT